MEGHIKTWHHTHHQDLHVLGDAVLPGEAEDVREVEGEVDDATAGRRQVGLVEEDAQQEALHDGRRGEGEQEEEEDDGVTVVQHLPSLDGDIKRNVDEIFILQRENHILASLL